MRVKNLVFSIVLSLAASIPLIAASHGGQFLQNNFSARAVGMGNAYGVIVNDPSALYWNPAGLANITGERTTFRKLEDLTKEAEAAFADNEFNDLLDGTESKDASQSVAKVERGFELQFYNAFGVQSLGRYVGFSGVGLTAFGGAIGVGAQGSLSQGIQGYDKLGAKTGSLVSHGGAGYLGYGRESGSLRWGFSFMGLDEGVGSQAVNGGGLNVGVQVVPIPILSAGFSLQNLAGAIQSKTDSDNKWEKLDTILRFSMAITTPPPNSDLKLMLGFTGNLDQAESQGLSLNLGVAYSLNSFSYFMIGIDNASPAAGLGLVFKPVQFAYAVNRDPLGLGFQHYAELNLVF